MPRRRRDEWGSIQTVDRSTHYIRFWADLHDGKGYRRCREVVRGSKRDAQARRAELRMLHSGDEAHPTLAQVREFLWLPIQRDRLADGSLAQPTMDLYDSMWRNHIAPTWADKLIDDIEPVRVQEWLLTLSKWSAVHSLSLAASMADVAVMYRKASSNPFRPAKRAYRMPRESKGRSKTVWSLETVQRALDSLRGSVLEVPAIMCGMGSCRVGEGMAARVDEVEFTEEHGMVVARVPISRQLRKTGLTDTLKNKWSYRTVCVPEPWSLRLREIAGERRAAGLEWMCDDGTGGLVSRSTIWARWSKAFGKGGALEGFERIPITNLRNSWETFMRWELGVDADLVDSMMGHGGRSTRTLHYDRPLPAVYAETCALAHLGAFRKAPSPKG